MVKILAIYGSPRRKGNTALLLQNSVKGAIEAGAEVEEVMLRDLKMSPCLEIYGCKQTVIMPGFDDCLAHIFLYSKRSHQNPHGSMSIPVGQEILA